MLCNGQQFCALLLVLRPVVHCWQVEGWAALAWVSSEAMMQGKSAWLSAKPKLMLHGTSCHTTALQLKACSPWHCREQ